MPSNTGNRRRKASPRGVGAIFTPDAGRRVKALLGIGLAALALAGITWVWALEPSRPMTGVSALDGASSTLLISSLAIPLAMAGIGLSAYSLAVRRTKRENERIHAILYKLEEMIAPSDEIPSEVSTVLAEPEPEQRQPSRWKMSRGLGVALVEAVLLIMIYYGLVAEYKSNLHMQEWVRANFAFGALFLNDFVLWVVSGLLVGVVAIQLRTREDVSELPLPESA